MSISITTLTAKFVELTYNAPSLLLDSELQQLSQALREAGIHVHKPFRRAFSGPRYQVSVDVRPQDVEAVNRVLTKEFPKYQPKPLGADDIKAFRERLARKPL